MNRRLTVLLPLVAATLTAGCTTFSDNDAVARVGDTELSSDTFDELLAANGLPDGTPIPSDFARFVTTDWMRLQTAPDEAAASYDQGFEASGFTCPSLIVTESRADADAALQRLDDGEAFGTVFADLNIDETLAAGAGAIPCIQFDQLPPESFDSPDGQALLAVTADEPYAIAELPQGDGTTIAALIGHRPFDTLTGQEVSQLSAPFGGLTPLSEFDVYVDPRLGRFDPDTESIVSLGASTTPLVTP